MALAITYTVDTPTFLSPAQGAVIAGTSVTLVASAFAVTPANPYISQTNASWYLYTDPALTQLAQQSVLDTVNLNSITFNNLTPGQTYYAVVSYSDTDTYSNVLSAPLSFTMQAASTFDGRISTLPLVTTLTGSELIPIIKNNENLSVRLSNVNTGGTLSTSGPTVAGNTTVYASSTNEYIITNYDLNTVYTVSSSAGSVSISNNIITLVAPSQVGPMTLTVNQKTYSINVIANVVNTPVITYPTSTTILNKSTLTALSSAFSSTDTQETQLSATWQLSTDPNFNTIFSTSINSISNLTTWTVNGLSVNTTYYIRVQYTGTVSGTSAWSPVVSFRTAAAFAPSAILYRVSSNVSNSEFGSAVSINSDGTVAIIGAWAENSDTGAAYIYTNQNGSWSQTARLASGVSNSFFGVSVSINSTGTVAIVGAEYENSGTGAAYIYTNQSGSWTQTARLASGVASSQFGSVVSINSDGTIAIVGAYYENFGTSAAYIFTNQNGTWTQTARLASGVANSYFGITVYINSAGTTAIIGSYSENSYTGAAYIYTNQSGTWSQTARLASGVANSYFGSAVSINSDGTIAIIGADGENSGTGAAYIYTNQSGTWTQTARFAGVNSGDDFGVTVSINSAGTIAIVGADSADSGTGAAYIYVNQNGSWTQTAKITNGVANSEFGYCVSIDSAGTTAIIGAYAENSYTGAAYISE
jgi:hypothetical protein